MSNMYLDFKLQNSHIYYIDFLFWSFYLLSVLMWYSKCSSDDIIGIAFFDFNIKFVIIKFIVYIFKVNNNY